MHSSPDIEHQGVILDIIGQRIDVSIISQSACASCKARLACSMSESEEKIVTVVTQDAPFYSVGEQVIVLVSKGMGMKAVLLAYLVPFAVLLGTLLLLHYAGAGEAATGLGAIGAAGLYYLGLYFFRNKIEKEIIFKIKKS